jgi:hypothetical protein
MSNSKISALTSAATVVGTEVLPIVQSSATVKVSVANLTTGLGTITAAKGGTGQTSYAVGDIIYADTTTTLAKLADVATGNALISGGVSTAPSWGKIGLTTHVSDVLPVANGGTNASTASITSFNNITGYTASGATGTTSTNLVFSTSPSITTPTLVGNATLSTGNIIQGTAAKGFNFTANTPAAGMTSQLLNWYEEGTFTPTAIGSTLPGVVTYTTQTGIYTRIGNVVTFRLYVLSTAIVGPTGNLVIGGLPFTSSSTTAPTAVSVTLLGAISLTAGYVLTAFINANASVVAFRQYATGGGTVTTVAPQAVNILIAGQYNV